MTFIGGRKGLILTLAATALVSIAASSHAAENVEDQAKRARGGAGLRVGDWQVVKLSDPASGSASETMAFEGWFQKGLDLHIAMENTIGFWQRTQTSTVSGGLGSETTSEVQAYLVPTLTSLKIYPMTRPSSPIEPYLSAGVGVVLGIVREKVTSTDPLVIPGESVGMHTGLGIQTGAGLDLNPAGMFGLTVGGRYQWATFGEDVGGAKMYRGPALNAGVTYRFRYE